VLDQIKASERAPTAIPFDELVTTERGQMWRESSQQAISTPIGLRGGHDVVETWFGARDGRTCAHGMLAGMPGSGKSTLYHVLIMGLTSRYSPKELRMYLIDGKYGTEFLPYSRLPHARVVSLNTHPELARSVLQDLVDEMARRNALFRGAGVEDLPRYRLKTGEAMPRLVLMVDEYQQLFDEDPDGSASDLMRRLAQQGRSSGIHMFLGSQRFGAPGMLHQQDIFGNIHLKVAMKLQPDEVMGLTEFGPMGKALIRSCDVAGKFALNDSGQDDRTVGGRAALLEPGRREEILDTMSSMHAGSSELPPIVLRGDVAPTIRDNAAVARLMSHPDGPTASELQRIARLDPALGPGLGIASWQAEDSPVVLALGRRLSVHQHAYSVLRRSVGQHLLMIGSRAGPRLGMLCGALLSALSAAQRGALEIDVLSAPLADADPTMLALGRIQNLAQGRRGIRMEVHRGSAAIEAAIAAAAATVRERASSTTPSPTCRLIVMLDPERIPALHRPMDAFRQGHGPAGKALRELLEGGSLVGVHAVLSSASLSQLAVVLDERRELGRFMHRACLQVAEDDSYALFRNRRGSALQDPDDPVSMALYMDMETSTSCRFRPYAQLGLSESTDHSDGGNT
jgi:S-DNA-T family DNA segregation ATPase FtsK/SpoIIIE